MSKLFVLLGLHRSGSSAIAGIMHTLEIHMGNHLLGPTQCNPKRHFEDLNFVMLNDEILHSQGFAWNQPPAKSLSSPSDELLDRTKHFLRTQIHSVWGLKDPRLLLTFHIWKLLFEEVPDVFYVFVHRYYFSSIRSLSQEKHQSGKG